MAGLAAVVMGLVLEARPVAAALSQEEDLLHFGVGIIDHYFPGMAPGSIVVLQSPEDGGTTADEFAHYLLGKCESPQIRRWWLFGGIHAVPRPDMTQPLQGRQIVALVSRVAPGDHRENFELREWLIAAKLAGLRVIVSGRVESLRHVYELANLVLELDGRNCRPAWQGRCLKNRAGISDFRFVVPR